MRRWRWPIIGREGGLGGRFNLGFACFLRMFFVKRRNKIEIKNARLDQEDISSSILGEKYFIITTTRTQVDMLYS